MLVRGLAISAAVALSGCAAGRFAGTTKVEVGPFPEGAAVFVVLAVGANGSERLQGIPDPEIDENLVQESLVSAPARRRDRAGSSDPARRRVHLMWIAAPRYVVLGLDAERRWYAWPFDASSLGIGADPGFVKFELNSARPDLAPAALLESARPAVGLERPQFFHPSYDGIDPRFREDAIREQREGNVRARNAGRRFLARCLDQAAAALDGSTPHDAVRAVAAFLNYRDARDRVDWTRPGEAAICDLYTSFLELRAAADAGDAAGCAEAMGKIRIAEGELKKIR